MEPPVIYRLDENDVVEAVEAGWLDFARHNGAPELGPQNVVGRRLVEFISSASLQGLWTQVLAAVRARGRTVRIPFRCDSPGLRRYMELELVPDDAGRVEHRATLQRRVHRDAVALLYPATPRSDQSLRLCSHCKRLEEPDGSWMEVEEAVTRLGLEASPRQPRVIHNLCDPCFESLDRLSHA